VVGYERWKSERKGGFGGGGGVCVCVCVCVWRVEGICGQTGGEMRRDGDRAVEGHEGG
jgi:hypothetical protein